MNAHTPPAAEVPEYIQAQVDAEIARRGPARSTRTVADPRCARCPNCLGCGHVFDHTYFGPARQTCTACNGWGSKEGSTIEVLE